MFLAWYVVPFRSANGPLNLDIVSIFSIPGRAYYPFSRFNAASLS